MKRSIAIFAVAALLVSLPSIFHGVVSTVVRKGDDVFQICSTLIRGSSKLAKHALSNDEIIDLAAKCRKPGGLDEVGKTLGKRNLPDGVLEDTYLRIAVALQKLPSDEAADMFKHLSGTPGFRTTIRKACSPSPQQSSGHLAELRLALQARKRNYKVVAIGEKFDDGTKRAASDIDLLLEKDRTRFACEVKEWSQPIPKETLRADADTLLKYCAENPPSKPVFFLTKPQPRSARRLLEDKGVTVLEGDMEDLLPLLDVL